MTTGKLIFSKIERLPDDWWTSPPVADPAVVWTVWDQNTYYLWGANTSNYEGIRIGESLNGGGMAGPARGPTIGRAHPHYVGVITMSKSDLPKNDAVFAQLRKQLKNGRNMVVPTYYEEFSLGTGIGSGIPHWGDIQAYLLGKIYDLGQTASTVDIPDGTYWPDCRAAEPFPQYPINNLEDLSGIINKVLSK